MKDISVIILTKNAESTVEKAITSAFLISDDVLVVDSGSEDATLTMASKLKARILHVTWEGYGRARNAGAREVKHDTVFCLDADEEITKDLAATINGLNLRPNIIYGFRRMNHLGNKMIKFGDWGNDVVYRLYNRNTSSWNLDAVHETVISDQIQKKKIKGALLHYTATDIETFLQKQKHYALLGAQKYFDQNKKAGTLKTALAPGFNFVKNYLLKLGFLDGREGWQIAKAGYQYTRQKYQHLKKFQHPK